jgi:hypothetical protein
MRSDSWGHDGRYYSSWTRELSKLDATGPTPEGTWWAELLEAAAPGTRDIVSRTFKQWNNIVRDYLRTETALRLSVGDEAQAVPVRVADGIPRPFASALEHLTDIAWLVLHRPKLEAAVAGTDFMVQNATLLQPSMPGTSDAATIAEVHRTAKAWLELLDKREAIQRIAAINEDVLGAYFFRVPEIRLYWVPIGITARLLDVSVDALSIVVLAHELAHAYTHLGRDIDGERWNDEDFAAADLEIVEGLAQFYAQVVCGRLRARVPSASEAYEKLLEHQSGAYKAHKEWVEDTERGGEIVRISMIECRTRRMSRSDAFLAAVERYREGVRGRAKSPTRER